jgi:hypothetical protein
MHLHLVVEEKGSYFEGWTNDELLKIVSRELFAWPFGAATPRDQGADIDYNHYQHHTFDRHVLDNSYERRHNNANDQV